MTKPLFECHAARVRRELARRAQHALAPFLLAEAAPRLGRAMQAALLGGKALRASLCLASARLFAPVSEGQWQVALAIEAMHAYSLVHDDLPAMDDAAERRGQPSLHIQCGEAMAILAGDALQSLAFALLAQADLTSARRVKLTDGLAQAAGAGGMAGGQSLELDGGAPSGVMLRRLHARKTGALIVYAVDAGAVSAGARTQERRPLRRYAEQLGLAYQMMDDVRDCGRDAAPNAAIVLGKTRALNEAQAHLRAAKDALKPCEGARTGKALLHSAADFVAARGA